MAMDYKLAKVAADIQDCYTNRRSALLTFQTPSDSSHKTYLFFLNFVWQRYKRYGEFIRLLKSQFLNTNLPWPSPQHKIIKLNFPFPLSTRFLVYLKYKVFALNHTNMSIKEKIIQTYLWKKVVTYKNYFSSVFLKCKFYLEKKKLYL